MAYRKKLIEVALPLEAINRESAREKSIRHGHPSTLHLWWARRPLAACRAVLFASLVDDPSAHPDRFPTEEAQEVERHRLFMIIEALVKWENVNNEAVLETARAEILRSTGGNPPPVLDPFCGGGSIPLEAQRLGLEAHASDLNPVAVLITKALIEIPPKFAGRPPVCPQTGQQQMARIWKGAQGLAEDVRYYGQWMRDRALERIGHLYPKVQLPQEHGGGVATAIAWLWARTVPCPNPTCGAKMPLMRSFILSTKKGKETWVEPVVDTTARTIGFTIRSGSSKPPEGPKLARGANFRCLVCGATADEKHIKAEALAGRMGAQMVAIVAEGRGGRIYLPPVSEHEIAAAAAKPEWGPAQPLANDPRNIWCVNYGLDTFEKLFTPRQLVALTTFSDLVDEAREQLLRDAATRLSVGGSVDTTGSDVVAYADAIATYLALAVSKSADYWSNLCIWRSDPKNLGIGHVFARQAIQMVWDYAEANIFSDSSGNWNNNTDWTCVLLEALHPGKESYVRNEDAVAAHGPLHRLVVSTDPPYYDNIAYADLSDFFYVWLRRSLHHVYPTIFSTMLVPKAQELVATPYRFGGSKTEAEAFFEAGLGRAFAALRAAQHPEFPLTVYYAFKQAESGLADPQASGNGSGALASTGWETMLGGLISAGFSISGTWPMRSEMSNRTLARDTNALASSIVLVCRPRPTDAPVITRREFRTALKRELPEALRNLQHGNIAPVDLAQASIGPGMAVYSRYSKVLEVDGSPMRVRTALQIINEVLDEVVAEQDSEYDTDTRWALAWYEQFGLKTAEYGEAETLSKAKNTSVRGLEEAGILQAKAGKVRLLGRKELPAAWSPATDRRFTVWEATQHLARALEEDGNIGAAVLLGLLGARGEVARDLAYRLYLLCERNKWADEALAYNALVVAWPEIVEEAVRLAKLEAGPRQGELVYGEA